MNRIEVKVASEGIAIGKVLKIERVKFDISDHVIEEVDVNRERKRFEQAVEKNSLRLEEMIANNKSSGEILEAHLSMLQDPFFYKTVMNYISERHNAIYSTHHAISDMVDIMSQLEDEYLRARVSDYKDIGENLLLELTGQKKIDLSTIKRPTVLVAEELNPSDTTQINLDYVKGMITKEGGATSHTSIIAQTIGIPAVFGINSIDVFEEGEEVVIDTSEKIVLKDLSSEVLEVYQAKVKEVKEKRASAISNRMNPTFESDGKKIDVYCNMGSLFDLEKGIENGAEGVGLFRTEFIYMNSTDFPTEEEQFEIYKKAAEMLGGRTLTIRTLDIGGDKGLPYFQFPKEDNPFLGWRALRVCFDHPDVFRTQLLAILRASVYGTIHILIPMVISVEEMIRVHNLLEEAKQELNRRKCPYDADIQIGMMIETPASVWMADDLIDYVDFFSIGTNDLTQYMLAVDRGNEQISNYFSAYEPAVLRAIQHVIDVSHKKGKKTGMCGGLASDLKAIHLLLGMGLDEFSVVASVIPEVKEKLRNASLSDMKLLSEQVSGMSKKTDIEQLLINQ